jgi:hypothetical protein
MGDQMRIETKQKIVNVLSPFIMLFVLIVLGFILEIIIQKTANAFQVIGSGSETSEGENWTPATLEFREGSQDLVPGHYKIVIFNSAGNQVAVFGPQEYSMADDYVSISVSGSPTDIVADADYYGAITNADDGGSISWVYPSTATPWGMDDESGTYASPPASITTACAGDQGQNSSPMMRIKNSIGEILLEWGGTVGGTTTSFDLNGIVRSWCDSATAESTPQ